LAEKRPEQAVSAENLTKRFGDFIAVDSISFSVEKGEIFGFLGPNGAGKTTTIKILCGLLTPSEGKATVLQWDVARESESIKQHIGYMSQKFSLYDDLTVWENLDFFGGVYGLHGQRMESRSEWVLEMAGLVGKQDIMTRDLPLGWKQRLALGCALLHEPPIIFLDEPTSGVDPVSRRSFWDLIGDLSEKGVTVFVTTHYMEEAEYCHRMALMAEGEIIAMGTSHELKNDWLKDSIMELDCDNPSKAAQILEDESLLKEVAVYGAMLHMVAEDGDKAMSRVRERLESEGFQIDRFERITPTLEDVFVTLTAGRAKD
jgi:ABC-2 type transport system ATP-binding protein